MNRSAKFFGGLLSVAIPLAGSSKAPAQVEFGTAVSHNGRIDSSPSGSGDVDVRLSYPAAPAQHVVYNEIATHEVLFTYAPGPADLLRTTAWIGNSSGIPWQALEIRLAGADFAGWLASDIMRAPDSDPVVDIGFGVEGLSGVDPQFMAIRHQAHNFFTLDSAAIVRSNDQGNGPLDAELTITFGEPAAGFGSFFLHYNVIPPPGDPTATGLTLSMTPIPVPEPATGMLLGGAGLAAIVMRRCGIG